MIYETRLRVEAPRAGTPKRTPPTADETDGDRGRPSDAAHRMPPIGCRPSDAAQPKPPRHTVHCVDWRRDQCAAVAGCHHRSRPQRAGTGWHVGGVQSGRHVPCPDAGTPLQHPSQQASGIGVPSSRPAIDELRHFHYIDLARALKFNLYQCAPRVVRPKHGGPQRGIHGN